MSRPEPKFSAEVAYFEGTDSNLTQELTSEPQSSSSKQSQSSSQQKSSHSDSTTLSSGSDSDKRVTSETTFPKKEFKKLTWQQSIYEGTVVNNNLHGQGFYFTQKNGKKYFYDGLFYMNKLEGYGQVFYEDGTHFQGLFKEHLRYGPGILSYTDGSQDVGFWNGYKLIRLACVVGYETVSILASTQSGKTKLLCNRYMIPLQIDESSYSFCQGVEASFINEKNLVNYSSVFNLDIRNPRSLFFHKKFYDEQFFGGQDYTIKVLADSIDESDLVREENNKDASLAERSEKLRNKIKEVNDNVEMFFAIRQNISQKVDICRKCCERVSIHQGSEATIVVEPTKSSEKSIQELFDPSLGTLDLSESFSVSHVADEASPEASEQNMLVYPCVCENEGTSAGLEYVEEQLQNVMRQEIYYRNIRDELQKKLDKINNTDSNKYESYKFKIVKVNEIWAWNNEQSVIDMQMHAFKHRNSEDMVNFSASELILGNRKEFGNTGTHEETCQKFLIACSKGKKEFIKECLRDNKINVNVADARGNTGIFFASAENQPDVISILTNFGAKLDQLNDEELTPLSMCFLKYIALKNNCKDWEKAFLSPTVTCKIPDLPKWYNIRSFLSISSGSSQNSMCLEPNNIQHHCSNSRIIDLGQRMSSLKAGKGLGTATRTFYDTTYIFDLNCNNELKKIVSDNSNTISNEALKSVQFTIMTLLEYGANPNSCEVPFPPLVLSLFTENPELVKQVIKANADINILITESLSCLHIAASLHPTGNNADICRMLANYGCNPNYKTLPSHWTDRRNVYTGKLPENFDIEDSGKNPLHLLCVRKDYEGDSDNYFCSVAKILLETNLDVKNTYLGHTPLSLAVLSGNINLAKCLIKSDAFNPYQPLEYGMGNILTLYSLRRFDGVLATDQCKAMLTALFDINANVLNEIGDMENAIVFAEDGDNFFAQFMEKDIKKAGKEKANAKSKKPDKHSQSGVIKEFLKNLGRQTIVKQIQITATEIFYECIEEDIIDKYDIFTIIASEYLTPDVAINNLEHLFQSKQLEQDRLEHANVKKLLQFVNAHRKIAKKPIRSQKGKSEPKQEPEEDMDILARQFELALNFQYIPPVFVTLPGLDDPLKYKVCFHCLRGKGKNLKLCPRCQMVQFCSAQCNKLNVKQKSQHGCNIVYYDMTDQEIAEISKEMCLNELVSNTRDKCLSRLKEIRDGKLIQEEEKLLEKWRADTYGTKFLRMKLLMDRPVSKRKDDTGVLENIKKQLLSKVVIKINRNEEEPTSRIIEPPYRRINCNIGLLQHLLERNFRKNPGETSLYCLENLLLKLQSRKKSESTIRTKQSLSRRSTLGGGSTLHNAAILDMFDVQNDVTTLCKCSTKTEDMKNKNVEQMQEKKDEIGKKFKHQQMHYIHDDHKNQPQHVMGLEIVQKKSPQIIKKLKKIPSRYRRFVEIIGTYFPDIDFSYWLLPYACYSDGQLYYKFCSNDIFKESYSFS